MAMPLSTTQTTAAPWITWINRPGEKFANAAPNTKALTTMPASSITYISPTALALGLRWGQVGGEGEAGGLRRMHARTNQQERDASGGGADPAWVLWRVAMASQDQNRERHDGEAAELEECAVPDERHAAPAQLATVRVGPIADQRSKWCEHRPAVPP